ESVIPAKAGIQPLILHAMHAKLKLDSRLRGSDRPRHMTKTYDRAYFDRWYRRSEVGGAARLARKVALAVATAEYHLERPIRSVLDIGCGEGAWRAPLLRLRPKAGYLGFDS